MAHVVDGEEAGTRVPGDDRVDEVLVPDDGHGFARWVRPHLAALTAFAVLEVGVGDADDVVQETLVRAWRRRSTFDVERGSARAWLAAILRDRARRHRVRLRPHPSTSVTDIDTNTDSTSDDVGAAVSALPRRQREVVTLHYLLDLPVREIAGLLSISESSVKSHLFDARVTLRSTLGTS